MASTKHSGEARTELSDAIFRQAVKEVMAPRYRDGRGRFACSIALRVDHPFARKLTTPFRGS